KVVVHDRLRRPINPWRDWLAYRKLLGELRRLAPEVVHTHSSKAGILGRAAAAAVGVPVIVHTIHGPPFHRYERPWRNRLYVAAERWAARRTDMLISVCEAMTEQFVGARVAPEHMFTTIYSGLEVERFIHPCRSREVVRAELGFGPAELVIAKAARLFELKGHDDVLAAAARIVPQFPQTRFLFIGDGPRRQELQLAAERLGLAEHVHFTGLVPPQRIGELFAAADIVVHCSLREGLARALPQALLAGRPVVSYDIDGAREVVIPGKTGYLVQPGDIERLSGSLIELIKDAGKRLAFGTEGRRRFADQFRHQRITDQIRRLYEALLAKKRPPGCSSGAQLHRG
ncbi:MAG TPA: glycosyltransferase family 1 protein, partial [Planctomycetaceae bacterium]|nr:glycosyltransferase family 1 protein [Planctomycetaceae bacterium]